MKTQHTLVLLAAIAAIVVIVALILKPAPNEDERQPVADMIDDLVAQDDRMTVTTFAGDTPDQWDGYARAQEIINETQGKEAGSESIVFRVVEDAERSTAYFATSEITEEEAFTGIYAYDTESYQWERLYKRTDELSSPPFAPVWHVLGLDEGKLIVRQIERSYSPGPCSDPLLDKEQTTDVDGTEIEVVGKLYAIDLESPYDQWEAYALPEELKSEREETQTACLAELNG